MTRADLVVAARDADTELIERLRAQLEVARSDLSSTTLELGRAIGERDAAAAELAVLRGAADPGCECPRCEALRSVLAQISASHKAGR